MSEVVKRLLLPDTVVPNDYYLSLEPDLKNFTFSGVVDIDVDVNEATKSVTMHAKQLAVQSASITIEETKAKHDYEGLETHIKDSLLTIRFAEEVPKGKARLSIHFTGILNDQLAGFYRSRYTDLNGQEKFMATTQFEAVDARRCFPCWDEPARKAVFHVTLTVPKELTALSNMPEKRYVITKEGKKVVEFLPSPKMSTYLLAFCIGEYDFIQGSTKDGVMVRCLCVPGRSSELAFSLDTGIKAIEFYNEFFGIPYPLPKLDMIAIPDFAAGAMENWGLVTYREVDLIIDPKKASQNRKERVASVVTHEIAHQWFGNLVTMAWWDDLWLNEGFASWMQTFCADHIYPEWNITETYVTDMQAVALRMDAMRSSHPIQVPIGRAETVEEVFDIISYKKGGSVVRMAYALLGREAFRKGLTNYLKKHSYANTESVDLWNAWTEASGKPISETMSNWTEQMGYPLITIEKATKKDGKRVLEMSQRWYLADGSQNEGDSGKTWVVPLIAGTSGGAQAPQYFKKKKFTMEVANGEGWVKLNFGQEIPLRVQYPTEMLEELSAALPTLPAADRMGMLSDILALSRSGEVGLVDLVKLMKGYKGEKNTNVWSLLSLAHSTLKNRLYLSDLTNKEEIESAINRFSYSLAAPVAEALGWDSKEGEDDVTQKLRSTVVGLVIAIGSDIDATILGKAQERFEAFEQDRETSKMNTDLRGTIMRLVVKKTSKKDLPGMVQRLKAIHNSTTDSAVHRDVYSALSMAQDRGTLEEILAWGMTKDVRNQDYTSLLSCVTGNITKCELLGGSVVFNFVRDRYSELYSTIGETSKMMFSHLVGCSFSGLRCPEQASTMRAFWESKNVDGISKSIEQGVEGVETRAREAKNFASSDLAKAAFWDKM